MGGWEFRSGDVLDPADCFADFDEPCNACTSSGGDKGLKDKRFNLAVDGQSLGFVEFNGDIHILTFLCFA
jgi:hypothetical protein